MQANFSEPFFVTLHVHREPRMLNRVHVGTQTVSLSLRRALRSTSTSTTCSASHPPQRQPPEEPTKLCRRCRQSYRESENTAHSCRYHSANWSGGEKAKALGFLRASDDPQDSLAAIHGTGILSFWDCCGADAYDAPGCVEGRHVAFGEEDAEGVFLVGR
jgi:hypothetical protein